MEEGGLTFSRWNKRCCHGFDVITTLFLSLGIMERKEDDSLRMNQQLHGYGMGLL